jgi:hypothetical protein
MIMKKPTGKPQDVWNDDIAPSNTNTADTFDSAVEPEFLEPEPTEITSVNQLKPAPVEYSLAGLKSDFPTATDLEKFVFDETNVSLKLKGIDPEKKYEIALAVLRNEDIDPRYLTNGNPYVDNNDLIPEDPIRPIPKRDPRLPNEEPMSIFHDMAVPHPDANMRAVDAKVMCQFKTYRDGSISYEILGPLEKQSFGEKVDKYGRPRPEKYIWIDPRTGEQAVRYSDGSFTRMGQRLRTLMESKRVNKNQSFWSVWIDRDFVQFNQGAIDNPWAN